MEAGGWGAVSEEAVIASRLSVHTRLAMDLVEGLEIMQDTGEPEEERRGCGRTGNTRD